MNIPGIFDYGSYLMGRNLYANNKVKNYKILDGDCTAVVKEGIEYRVHIKISHKGIEHMECSCTGTYKYNCRHMAAVLIKTDQTYGIDNIVKRLSENIKYVRPFVQSEKYQYYNLDAITKDSKISEKEADNAKLLIEQGNIELNKISNKYYESLDRQVCEVHGTVKMPDGGRHKVRISFDKDNIVNKSCDVPGCISSMVIGTQRDNFCVHQLALLFLTDDYLQKNDIGDSTDLIGIKMLEMCRKKRRSEAVEKSNHLSDVRLEPRLEKENGKLKAAFKVGRDKLYVVKNLSEFVNLVEEHETMPLGKTQQLDFSASRFNEHSQKLYDFIKKYVNRENSNILKLGERVPYYYRDIVNNVGLKDKLSLEGDAMDDFFEIMNGSGIDYDDKDKYLKKSVINLRDNKLKVTITISKDVQKKIFHGINVTGKFPYVIEGEKFFYYIEDKWLNRDVATDEGILRDLLFMTNKSDDDEGGAVDEISFKIGRNNLAAFYYKVLPELTKEAEIIEEDADFIRSHLLPEAKIAFYLDVENNVVSCKLKAIYGDTEIETNELMDRTMVQGFRDYEAEGRAMDCVNKYFEEYDDKDECFLVRDEDAIYELLQKGIADMLELGEVNTTDDFKKMGIKKNFKVTVGVSVQSDVMNLDISSDELTRGELLDILYSYKKKKRYHRLKSGDFIDLENDQSLAALLGIYESLHISPKEFVKGKMQIPAYRALYMDKMLEQNESLYSERDKSFKKLIKEFKTVDESDYEVPESLKDTMRKYQKYGYKWLRTLEEYGFGGILADDMGLGKTIQVISVIQSFKDEGREGCSLIVCPASVVFNWKEEFAKFAPGLKVGMLAGSQNERKAFLREAAEYDVMVTSYDTLRRDIDAYDGIMFEYQVIDEAQFIKNPTTGVAKAVKIVKAKHKVALTGTPIENRLSELWSIFDYIMPGYLYSYDDFKKNFENQIVKYKDEAATARLKKMVSPFILRRLKEDVLKDLPDKLEEIRYAKFGEEQQKLYDAQVTHMKMLLEEQQEEDFNKNKLKLLAEMTKIRQICCDPTLLFDNFTGGSAKREACIELVKSAIEGGHKILIFSQFTSMLALLEKDLEKDGIGFYKITGETPKETRVELVKKFNENEIPVFLISLKAGGTGLNLTGADVVIHYDPWWNLAVQNQATDRAHRIGQKNIVSVYKLIAKGSIEEKIVKLQEEKKNLADEILGGEMGGLSSLTKEELLDLIG